ncbi:MAG: hypothetical protein WC460_03175 [Patescibacteria group bacterium]
MAGSDQKVIGKVKLISPDGREGTTTYTKEHLEELATREKNQQEKQAKVRQIMRPLIASKDPLALMRGILEIFNKIDRDIGNQRNAYYFYCKQAIELIINKLGYQITASVYVVLAETKFASKPPDAIENLKTFFREQFAKSIEYMLSDLNPKKFSLEEMLELSVIADKLKPKCKAIYSSS